MTDLRDLVGAKQPGRTLELFLGVVTTSLSMFVTQSSTLTLSVFSVLFSIAY